jgi:hypothetical protein
MIQELPEHSSFLESADSSSNCLDMGRIILRNEIERMAEDIPDQILHH